MVLSVDPGHVYVFFNPYMKDLVKIGKTSRDPAERASELSGPTGIPGEFVVAYSRYFSNCGEAERFLHAILQAQGHRVNENREFFNITVQAAIDLIMSLPDGQISSCQSIAIQGNEMQRDFSGQQLEFRRYVDPQAIWWATFQDALDCALGRGDALQDPVAALSLFKKAATLGSPLACMALGDAYRLGQLQLGLDDIFESEEEFLSFIRTEPISAHPKFEHLRARAKRMKVNPDIDAATKYYKQAESLGYFKAYRGLAYLFGSGPGLNEQNSLKCWKKFASTKGIDRFYGSELYRGILVDDLVALSEVFIAKHAALCREIYIEYWDICLAIGRQNDTEVRSQLKELEKALVPIQ